MGLQNLNGLRCVVVALVLMGMFNIHVTAQNNDGASATSCSDETCRHGKCDDDIGVVNCVCDEGWTGASCAEDVDECTGKSACDQTCTNTDGSFECSCFDGYRSDRSGCIDINECVEKTANCGPNEFCTNTVGGFQCSCRPGYGGPECQDQVKNVYGGQLLFEPTEGQDWTSDLEQSHTQAFKDMAAKVHNSVSAVLKKNNVEFIDVEVVKFTQDSGRIQATFQVSSAAELSSKDLEKAMESGLSNCDGDDVLCEFGSGSDVIYGAVKKDTAIEEEYDLCSDDRNNVCHDASTVCTTVNGTATCQCKEGFEPWPLFDNACKDVDECEADGTRSLCGAREATCINTDGAYTCDCPKTHRWNHDALTCQWYDICRRDNPCVNDGKCFNTDDNKNGFVCRCEFGWTGRVCGSPDPEYEELLWWLIAVGTLLSALILLLLIIILCLCCKRYRERKRKKEEEDVIGSYDFGDMIGDTPLPRHTPNTPRSVPKSPATSLKINNLSPTVHEMNSPIARQRTNQNRESSPGGSISDHSRGEDSGDEFNITKEDIIAEGKAVSVKSPAPMTTQNDVNDDVIMTGGRALGCYSPSSVGDKKQKKSVGGSYNLGFIPTTKPFSYSKGNNSNGDVKPSSDVITPSTYVITNDDDNDDVMPVGDESPPLGKKGGKKSVFGSYDLGFTPRKTVKKVPKDVKDPNSDGGAYLLTFFSDRL